MTGCFILGILSSPDLDCPLSGKLDSWPARDTPVSLAEHGKSLLLLVFLVHL